jgi:hypothetical protein
MTPTGSICGRIFSLSQPFLTHSYMSYEAMNTIRSFFIHHVAQHPPDRRHSH